MTSTRPAYLAWMTVCVVWGTTYLGIRIALETIPPALVGAIRYTIAGLVIAAVLALRGERLPGRPAWPGLLLLGVLMIAVGNGFVIWAEQWVPSGIAAVVVASAPFWMAGVEAAIGGERITVGTVSGLVVGFAGILVLVWPELFAGGERHFAAGVVALQIACIGWALGSAYSKRHARQENALGASALQMLFGGLVMFVVATVRGEWGSLAFTPRTLAAESYLIVCGSIIGYSAYVYALKYLPVSTVSLYAYVNPVIAVVLGTLLAGEPFTGRVLAASALVFAGVAIVRLRSSDRGQTSKVAGSHLRPSALSPVDHAAASDDPPAAHQAHQEQHDGDDQQNPDEVTERVATDHPKQPQDDQDDRNGLEHGSPSPNNQSSRLGAS